jgi:hypothetical protein
MNRGGSETRHVGPSTREQSTVVFRISSYRVSCGGTIHLALVLVKLGSGRVLVKPSGEYLTQNLAMNFAAGL